MALTLTKIGLGLLGFTGALFLLSKPETAGDKAKVGDLVDIPPSVLARGLPDLTAAILAETPEIRGFSLRVTSADAQNLVGQVTQFFTTDRHVPIGGEIGPQGIGPIQIERKDVIAIVRRST